MTPGAPTEFLKRFYMNLDGWDGFRDKRDELIGKLTTAGNVVAISGDLHTFIAGVPSAGGDATKNIVEFTCGAVSSSPYRALLLSQIKNDPVLSKVAVAPILASKIDDLLTDKPSQVNPHLGYVSSNSHGYCVAEVDGNEIVVTMNAADSGEVTENYAGKADTFAPLIKKTLFKTTAGKKDLHQQVDGAWKRWDPATLAWV